MSGYLSKCKKCGSDAVRQKNYTTSNIEVRCSNCPEGMNLEWSVNDWNLSQLDDESKLSSYKYICEEYIDQHATIEDLRAKLEAANETCADTRKWLSESCNEVSRLQENLDEYKAALHDYHRMLETAESQAEEYRKMAERAEARYEEMKDERNNYYQRTMDAERLCREAAGCVVRGGIYTEDSYLIKKLKAAGGE